MQINCKLGIVISIVMSLICYIPSTQNVRLKQGITLKTWAYYGIFNCDIKGFHARAIVTGKFRYPKQLFPQYCPMLLMIWPTCGGKMRLKYIDILFQTVIYEIIIPVLYFDVVGMLFTISTSNLRLKIFKFGARFLPELHRQSFQDRCGGEWSGPCVRKAQPQLEGLAWYLFNQEILRFVVQPHSVGDSGGVWLLEN